MNSECKCGTVHLWLFTYGPPCDTNPSIARTPLSRQSKDGQRQCRLGLKCALPLATIRSERLSHSSTLFASRPLRRPSARDTEGCVAWRPPPLRSLIIHLGRQHSPASTRHPLERHLQTCADGQSLLRTSAVAAPLLEPYAMDRRNLHRSRSLRGTKSSSVDYVRDLQLSSPSLHLARRSVRFTDLPQCRGQSASLGHCLPELAMATAYIARSLYKGHEEFVLGLILHVRRGNFRCILKFATPMAQQSLGLSRAQQRTKSCVVFRSLRKNR